MVKKYNYTILGLEAVPLGLGEYTPTVLLVYGEHTPRSSLGEHSPRISSAPRMRS